MTFRSLTTLFAAIALISCSDAPAKSPPRLPASGHPGLWKVADADTTIYLFGSIHLLPQNYKWQTPVFDRAANAASELILEVGDLDDQAKTMQAFMAIAMSPDNVPVLDRITPSKRAELAAMIKQAGYPPDSLNAFDTWAVAISLSATMIQGMKLSPADGVEHVLAARFRAQKKPVSGLETASQQFGYFDTLPEAAQRVFLTSLVDEKGNMDAEFTKMISAWGKGDDKAIALSFDDELRLSPELSEVLLRKRNANWADWVATRMAKPGTLMIAVGAGHLAGDQSVQALLAKRGIKVTRIQ
jgi:uncharacterized protein